jgi:hypothetical protein
MSLGGLFSLVVLKEISPQHKKGARGGGSATYGSGFYSGGGSGTVNINDSN